MFAISGNALTLAGAVTAGTSYPITLQSTLRGVTSSQSFTIKAVAADSLLDAMVVEYRLNEATGTTTLDSSPRKFNGTLGDNAQVQPSDPTWTATGLQCATEPRRASTPYDPGLDSATLHAFFAVRATAGANARLLSRDNFNGNYRSWAIYQENSYKLKIVTYTSTGSIAGTYTTTNNILTANTYTPVEVLISGTSVTIRVNGTTIETGTLAAGITAGRPAPLVIGEIFNGSSVFTGEVGYVALYSSELTSTNLTAARTRLTSAMTAKGVTV